MLRSRLGLKLSTSPWQPHSKTHSRLNCELQATVAVSWVISCLGRTASETYPWITCLFKPQDLAAPISEADVISLGTLWSVKILSSHWNLRAGLWCQQCRSKHQHLFFHRNSLLWTTVRTLLSLSTHTLCPVILFRRLPGKHLRGDFSNPIIAFNWEPHNKPLNPKPAFSRGLHNRAGLMQLTEL